MGDNGKRSSRGSFTCICCGLAVVDQRYSGDRKFCSNSCQMNANLQESFEAWISGQAGCVGIKRLRRLVEKRDGYSCSSCGIDEWNGSRISLEVEHKDGDSSNNSPSNVCFLCPNCHSQTETFKVKNKGNGRHARRERYSMGLSY